MTWPQPLSLPILFLVFLHFFSGLLIPHLSTRCPQCALLCFTPVAHMSALVCCLPPQLHFISNLHLYIWRGQLWMLVALCLVVQPALPKAFSFLFFFSSCLWRSACLPILCLLASLQPACQFPVCKPELWCRYLHLILRALPVCLHLDDLAS